MKLCPMWVLLDLDDTLVDNAGAFREGLERLADGIARLAGSSLDAARLGLRRHRRPGYLHTGLVQAALAAYWELTPAPARDDLLAVIELAEAPFAAVPPVFPGVLPALGELTAAGHRLAVWTLGDPVFQSAKLVRTGLHPFMERVFALQRKDEAALRGVLAELGADRFALIGNSAADDVRPALALGGTTVWVGDPAWESERLWQPPADAPLLRAPDFPSGVRALLRGT